MIASWVDHIPVPVGIALLVVLGLFVIAGGIYLMLLEYGFYMNRSRDAHRDVVRGVIERRARRIEP